MIILVTLGPDAWETPPGLSRGIIERICDKGWYYMHHHRRFLLHSCIIQKVISNSCKF